MKVLRILTLAGALGVSTLLSGPVDAVDCPGIPACQPASVCFQYCKSHRPFGYTLCAVECDPFGCCFCDYRPLGDPYCTPQ